MPIRDNIGRIVKITDSQGVMRIGTDSGGVVFSAQAANQDGTADWSLFTNNGPQTGGDVSYTIGTFGVFTPASSTCDPSDVTCVVTQTSTASFVTQNTSAVVQPQIRTCTELTPATGTGIPGTCTMPNSAIGGTDTQNVTITAASSMNVTPSTTNGGIISRTQSVPNDDYIPTWTTANAIVSLGTMMVSAVTGAATGIPGLINARFVSIDWVDAGTGDIYPVIDPGNPSVFRVARITIQAPASGFLNPNATGTVDFNVTQVSAIQSDFVEADLNVTCDSAIDGGGASSASIATGLGYDYPGIITVGSDVPRNPSYTDARDVDVTWTWTGDIPPGFNDEGDEVSFTDTVTCSQERYVPPGAATSGNATPGIVNVTLGNASNHTITVTGANGAWTVEESSDRLVIDSIAGNTATPFTGSFRIRYDGGAIGPLGETVTLVGGISGEGNDLDTVMVTTFV